MTTDKQSIANDLIYIELCKITYLLKLKERNVLLSEYQKIKVSDDALEMVEKTAKLKLKLNK